MCRILYLEIFHIQYHLKLKKLKFLIYIAPFHRFFIISKVLYNNI